MVLEKLFEVQSGLPETHVLDMFDMFSALWVDERLVADTFAFLPKERWLVVLVRPEMQHCVHWKCRECQDCSTHFGGGTSSFATRPEHCVSWCFFWKFGPRKKSILGLGSCHSCPCHGPYEVSISARGCWDDRATRRTNAGSSRKFSTWTTGKLCGLNFQVFQCNLAFTRFVSFLRLICRLINRYYQSDIRYHVLQCIAPIGW